MAIRLVVAVSVFYMYEPALVVEPAMKAGNFAVCGISRRGKGRSLCLWPNAFSLPDMSCMGPTSH